MIFIVPEIRGGNTAKAGLKCSALWLCSIPEANAGALEKRLTEKFLSLFHYTEITGRWTLYRPWRAAPLYSFERKGREGSRFDLPAAKDVSQPPTMDFLTLLCVHTHKGCERFMTLL